MFFLGLRGAFEKNKSIFSIAPVGNLEKSRVDALRGGTGRWPLAPGVLSGRREGERNPHPSQP